MMSIDAKIIETARAEGDVHTLALAAGFEEIEEFSEFSEAAKKGDLVKLVELSTKPLEGESRFIHSTLKPFYEEIIKKSFGFSSLRTTDPLENWPTGGVQLVCS